MQKLGTLTTNVFVQADAEKEACTWTGGAYGMRWCMHFFLNDIFRLRRHEFLVFFHLFVLGVRRCSTARISSAGEMCVNKGAKRYKNKWCRGFLLLGGRDIGWMAAEEYEGRGVWVCVTGPPSLLEQNAWEDA